jgi:uncharacterized membrane protein
LETVSKTEAPATQPAAPMPPPTATPIQRYQALGTEPFWSVFVLPGRLRYTTPENIAGTHFPAKYAVEGEAQIWTGTFEGSTFTLRIAPGTCSDGMSDTVFAYTAQVAFAGKTLQGCARTN